MKKIINASAYSNDKLVHSVWISQTQFLEKGKSKQNLYKARKVKSNSIHYNAWLLIIVTFAQCQPFLLKIQCSIIFKVNFVVLYLKAAKGLQAFHTHILFHIRPRNSSLEINVEEFWSLQCFIVPECTGEWNHKQKGIIYSLRDSSFIPKFQIRQIEFVTSGPNLFCCMRFTLPSSQTKKCRRRFHHFD